MVARLCALSLLLCAIPTSTLAAYDAAPRRSVDLSGRWIVNEALSDDAEKMLSERLDEERRRYARDRRLDERAQPEGLPPPLTAEGPPPAREPRPWQKRRLENFHRMLGMTKTLDIQQQDASFTIASGMESRRLTAGSRTQVSMPEGELADSSVGWDGDTFVIDRRVRRGPRVTERFRLLKSGQLEYTLAVGGDTELAGLKVRRVLDRGAKPHATGDSGAGPLR
jgi:hypothetical protein